MDFDEWIKKLDRIFADAYSGMTHDDFEDHLWWQDFDSGLSPQQAHYEWARQND